MFGNDFIYSFSQLGERLLGWLGGSLNEPVLDNAIVLSYSDNPFFTPYMQRRAVETIARTFLVRGELERWKGNYVVTAEGYAGKETGSGNCIGIIMAGNIPLVGFHDFLCVMASGNNAVIKLSSKDKYLLPALAGILCGIDAGWEGKIEFTGNMREYINMYPDKICALISTGSDTTRAAVAEEFAGLPMLLRGRRFSFAVLSGKESVKELEALAEDVFLYYGLGCRSVNYLFVPEGYDFGKLINCFSVMRELAGTTCYMNIYRRNRAVFLMEGEEFIDGGFFLINKASGVHPPVTVIGYAEYDSGSDILAFEEANRGNIQKKYRTFGLAQAPLIDEYADGIDVMRFIFKHA